MTNLQAATIAAAILAQSGMYSGTPYTEILARVVDAMSNNADRAVGIDVP